MLASKTVNESRKTKQDITCKLSADLGNGHRSPIVAPKRIASAGKGFTQVTGAENGLTAERKRATVTSNGILLSSAIRCLRRIHENP